MFGQEEYCVRSERSAAFIERERIRESQCDVDEGNRGESDTGTEAQPPHQARLANLSGFVGRNPDYGHRHAENQIKSERVRAR